MMYNDDLKINRTIQKIMIDENKKVNDISANIGKSKQMISNTLNTQQNITINTLDSFAAALGYDIKIQFVKRETGKIVNCE